MRTSARVEPDFVSTRIFTPPRALVFRAFTDADRFRVLFQAPDLRPDERALVLTAAVFIDIQYFEKKAG